jgi:hypothetical protein
MGNLEYSLNEISAKKEIQLMQKKNEYHETLNCNNKLSLEQREEKKHGMKMKIKLHVLR